MERPNRGRGAGARLDLADGREVLDMSASPSAATSAISTRGGGGHPCAGREAVLRDERLGLCAARRTGDRLLELAGFDGGRVFFTLGGADANEHAVKIARQASAGRAAS